MTGTLFPVALLPSFLRDIAQWIPITHSLDAMRLALLEGRAFPGLEREIVILALFSGVLLPLGAGLFSLALRHARLRGTLSFY